MSRRKRGLSSYHPGCPGRETCRRELGEKIGVSGIRDRALSRVPGIPSVSAKMSRGASVIFSRLSRCCLRVTRCHLRASTSNASFSFGAVAHMNSTQLSAAGGSSFAISSTALSMFSSPAVCLRNRTHGDRPEQVKHPPQGVTRCHSNPLLLLFPAFTTANRGCVTP